LGVHGGVLAFAAALLAGAAAADPVVRQYTVTNTTVPTIRSQIPFLVIEPDGFDPAVAYPVVVYLHGKGGSYDGDVSPTGPQTALRQSYKSAYDTGQIGPVLLVVPDGYGKPFGTYTDVVETGWSDSRPGALYAIPNEFDVDSVIDWVDGAYETLGDAGRVIVGHSMGGGGAAKFAAKYPHRFLAWVGFDAPLNTWDSGKIHQDHYGTEEYFNLHGNPWYWIAATTPAAEGGGSNVARLVAHRTRFRQVVGSGVGEPNNPVFRQVLLDNDITDFEAVALDATPHDEYKHFDSGHDFGLVIGADEGESWVFIRKVLEAAALTVRDVPGVGAQDGWVLESGAGSGVGGSTDPASTNLLLGDDAQNRGYKSVLSFNLAALDPPLPAGAVVESAVLKLTRTVGQGAPAGSVHGQVRANRFGTSVALESADWRDQPPMPWGVDRVEVPAQNVRTSARLNQRGVDAVNAALRATGTVQIRLAYDVVTSGPGTVDTRAFASGDHGTAGFRPVLNIRYRQP
jgi:S-formylglutathione hydrolase FrmB